MSLRNCKVYKDGSHYIAIRSMTGHSSPRYKRPPEERIIVDDYECENSPLNTEETVEEHKRAEIVKNIYDSDGKDCILEKKSGKRLTTRSDEFLRWYRVSVGMKGKKRRKFLEEKLAPYFKNNDELTKFLDYKLQCRERAEIMKRIRCIRRASLHGFNYFCTFTYDSKKLSEQDFQKKLLNTLRHFASRKGWKYMGAWERGGDTDRLHFHALMAIPEDTMSGSMETRREYDVKKKRMVEYVTNTFFEERFGRNEFDFIDGAALSLNNAAEYVLKYIEKDGGRIICSRGLRTFIETDIDNEDIIARLREDSDQKYILFDDFTVYKDGEKLGTFSPGILSRAKTVN